jgi:hypothetical protein
MVTMGLLLLFIKKVEWIIYSTIPMRSEVFRKYY